MNEATKERPILFSGPMVQAVLAGTKTQTRRTLKQQPIEHDGMWMLTKPKIAWGAVLNPDDPAKYCPYGQPGDHLRVKEHAWMWCEKRPNGTTKKGRPKFHYVPLRSAPVIYCADHPEKPRTDIVSPETGNKWGWRKKLGRFLPSWASRMTLEIVSVRVERLQDISEEDAVAEGLHRDPNNPGLWTWGDYPSGSTNPCYAYELLWKIINGDDSWEMNPWVWVIEFKRLEVGK